MKEVQCSCDIPMDLFVLFSKIFCKFFVHIVFEASFLSCYSKLKFRNVDLVQTLPNTISITSVEKIFYSETGNVTAVNNKLV